MQSQLRWSLDGFNVIVAGDRESALAEIARHIEDKIAAFFGKFSVSQMDFKKAWDSFDVNAKLQRANELARRYDISSVPSIVINGKYTSDGSMAGSWDKLIELTNQLAAAEHAAH